MGLLLSPVEKRLVDDGGRGHNTQSLIYSNGGLIGTFARQRSICYVLHSDVVKSGRYPQSLTRIETRRSASIKAGVTGLIRCRVMESGD